jgi:hypothetical protein
MIELIFLFFCGCASLKGAAIFFCLKRVEIMLASFTLQQV